MRTLFSITIQIACALLVSTVSAQTVALHADFDGDVTGKPPSTDLPGSPDGDYLQLYTSGGEILVQPAYGALDQNPIVVTRQNLDSFGIQFWVDPDLRDCAVYTLRWKSMLLKEVQFFYITFSSPNTQVMGSVEFRRNREMTASGSWNVLASTYTPGTPQEFEVRLDIENKLMDVIIDGVPDPQGQGLGHYQVGGDGLRFVGINFGMTDMYTVVFDDLHVTAEGCPSVATEERSWSAVKAFYR